MYAGDAYENRTRVTAVKGRCLDLLTNAPCIRCVKTTTSNTHLYTLGIGAQLGRFRRPTNLLWTPAKAYTIALTGYKR